jgi:hypothetical protein
LEEGLKARARASGIEIIPKDTLIPVVHKLKAANVINEFEFKNIEALGDIRNKAAYGGDFPYSANDVKVMQERISEILSRLIIGS